MINIYSNDYQSALKYLKDTEANLHNILVMAVDFNIGDYDWYSSYLFYLVHNNLLLDIADLKLSVPIQQIPTYYTNNLNDVNSVINLIFLHPNLREIDNH